MHHCQGIRSCPSRLLSKGQLQKLLGKALHLSRAETSQLISIGVQNCSPTIGLPFLMHETPTPGACLEAGAADVVVLVGEEGEVSHFESVEVGLVVVGGDSARLVIAFVLHGARKRRIRANGQSKICSKP